VLFLRRDKYKNERENVKKGKTKIMENERSEKFKR
jgi:hypothetical protein